MRREEPVPMSSRELPPASPDTDKVGHAATGHSGEFGWRIAVEDIAPPFASVLAYLAGLALLASAAQPAMPDRLATLLEFWPLATVEFSHFLASVVGVLLLIVAGGLWRRLDGAYWLALLLLAAGAVFSLIKALDWEEAAVLTAFALLLAPARRAFFRRSRLTSALLTGPWLVGVAVTIVLVFWLLLLSYENVAYRDELWWTFVRDGDIERSFRAVGGAAVVALLALMWLAIHPSRPRPDAARRGRDRDKAAAILKTAEQAHGEANLLFTGDKRFVFTETDRSFVMFRPWGGLWIAMGDPVGPQSERTAALMAFHAAADVASASPVIYAASQDLLPTLIDLGYAVRKIGEVAVVELSDFSLEGSAKAKLRQVKSRLSREGWRVSVFDPDIEQDGAKIDWAALQKVSDAWLAKHVGREKEFSMGRFTPDYLRRFPIAVVAKEGQAPVAFASLWPTPGHGEISVDLMRYGGDAPPGVMDFLFIGIMEWAKDAGYKRLDIGMTPLAGLSAARYAPALSKLGAALYDAGEDVYGFKGLRGYKAKFAPTWRSTFIAAPGHVSLPYALAGAAVLTAGGLLALLRK